MTTLHVPVNLIKVHPLTPEAVPPLANLQPGPHAPVQVIAAAAGQYLAVSRLGGLIIAQRLALPTIEVELLPVPSDSGPALLSALLALYDPANVAWDRVGQLYREAQAALPASLRSQENMARFYSVPVRTLDVGCCVSAWPQIANALGCQSMPAGLSEAQLLLCADRFRAEYGANAWLKLQEWNRDEPRTDEVMPATHADLAAIEPRPCDGASSVPDKTPRMADAQATAGPAEASETPPTASVGPSRAQATGTREAAFAEVVSILIDTRKKTPSPEGRGWLTQPGLEVRLGVPRNTIGHWEGGRRLPSPEQFQAWWIALGRPELPAMPSVLSDYAAVMRGVLEPGSDGAGAVDAADGTTVEATRTGTAARSVARGNDGAQRPGKPRKRATRGDRNPTSPRRKHTRSATTSVETDGKVVKPTEKVAAGFSGQKDEGPPVSPCPDGGEESPGRVVPVLPKTGSNAGTQAPAPSPAPRKPQRHKFRPPRREHRRSATSRQTPGEPILSDRPASERLKEVALTATSDGVPVSTQIWDLTRLKRIHDAVSVRDDLIVDFTAGSGEGLPVLPASSGSGGYDGYLTVIPAEILADIYIQHGGRLLEGNVRTFLGRRSDVNKGIARTVANEPERFFAFNNGIAATATAIETAMVNGSLRLRSATDLQIVNGAQTTASLSAARRDGTLPEGRVFVPMKLSVIAPDLAADLIPSISRFANRQNSIRPSDFFANHPFHRRMEEISRRILAPTTGNSQIQTHWYYERARGQYLNDLGLRTGTAKGQFELANPRGQVITKTDLAKVEISFGREPDIACKGAEKAFTTFAERIVKEWQDESRKILFTDDWYRCAVARVILFRATERIVSGAPWYEGGYRAQIVAYACARLSQFALERPGGAGLNFLRVWQAQTSGSVLDAQILAIGEVMAAVLRSPPQAGQNVTEWAKQQACRKRALEAEVPLVRGFDDWIVDTAAVRAAERQQAATGRVDASLDAMTTLIEKGAAHWEALRSFCRDRRLLTADDERALVPACRLPQMMPNEYQAIRILKIEERASQLGWPQR